MQIKYFHLIIGHIFIFLSYLLILSSHI